MRLGVQQAVGALVTLLIAVVFSTAPDRLSAQSVAQPAARIAVVVESGDDDAMISALSYAVRRARRAASRQEVLRMQVIAHGKGLRFLRADQSPVIRRLMFAANSFPSITFTACEWTTKSVAKREGERPTILPQAAFTPAGPKLVKKLEEEGWMIVRY